MDSNSTCPSGGEHKPTIDDEVGEKICQKCGKVLGKLEPTDLGYDNVNETDKVQEFDPMISCFNSANPTFLAMFEEYSL